eukprot:TRINITY_DN41128_c0_g1_i1.p1 TRINITY_DN41128_c0_g1~~TRINITY_DN41128_c0_g1_i1.p1  ORF type:complete len:343 (-),score=30.00 TRINITY_DN41128_c0_g1_i1:142-1083(-)
MFLQAWYRRSLDLYPFAYLWAVVGSIDLLITKFTLQLFRIFVSGQQADSERSSELMPFAIGLTVSCHIAVFSCQVAAAHYRKALESLPLFLASGAMMQVLVCGTFFQEFSEFGRLQATAFLGGFALALAGMVATSLASPPDAGEEVDQEVIQSPSTIGNLPVFKPPTAVLQKPHPKDMMPGRQIPIISSGLLERNSSSLSNSDLLLLGQLNTSAMCFGGHYASLKVSGTLGRRFESEPQLRPLLQASLEPDRPSLPVVASAPPYAGPLAGMTGLGFGSGSSLYSGLGSGSDLLFGHAATEHNASAGLGQKPNR